MSDTTTQLEAQGPIPTVIGPVPTQVLGDLKESPRKVVIIGASISGLTLLLALRRVCHVTQLNLQIIIYDRKASFWEQGPVYILWRWSIALLVELGLGNGLKRVAKSIDTLKSMDTETGEVYVSWPPSPGALQLTPEEAHKMGDPSLPVMMAVRHSDLVRLLLIALSNADELYLASATGECKLPNLSSGNWFDREGYLKMISELRMGRGLDSFLFSASNGLITARFDDGSVEQACMLIGADGLDSTVRDLLLNRHYPPQFANSVVVSGVTDVFKNLEHPTPTILTNGTHITPFAKADADSVFPVGSCTTFIGPRATFGVTSMGNGVYGWNLILAQDQAGRLAETWSQNLRGIRRQDSTNSLLQQEHQPLAAVGDGKGVDSKESGEPASQGQQTEQAFEETLNGLEVRDMALHVAASLKLPESAYSVMALTIPELTHVHDVFDVGSCPPPSYTSPNFHPGRVVLIGDAAHAMATNAQGSLGAGLGITDAGLLAKLVATDFDVMRVSPCNAIVTEARNEGAWNRTESSWIRSLLRLGSKYMPGSWKASSFYQMMTRGSIPHDATLPSLSSPNRHKSGFGDLVGKLQSVSLGP
ncbi:hypothetical protein SeMB42_g02160 [Synchytrium endobioticum]|uniref:FAD-binding domain-containing protein n=1 Tax=Synchytrium endobioticum TaxID=286115 RepID=A0A507DGA4_9FUNG|nr:hypothetical protein SeMB42_g02160 [Synchytrium endobioticum]